MSEELLGFNYHFLLFVVVWIGFIVFDKLYVILKELEINLWEQFFATLFGAVWFFLTVEVIYWVIRFLYFTIF